MVAIHFFPVTGARENNSDAIHWLTHLVPNQPTTHSLLTNRVLAGKEDEDEDVADVTSPVAAAGVELWWLIVVLQFVRLTGVSFIRGLLPFPANTWSYPVAGQPRRGVGLSCLLTSNSSAAAAERCNTIHLFSLSMSPVTWSWRSPVVCSRHALTDGLSISLVGCSLERLKIVGVSACLCWFVIVLCWIWWVQSSESGTDDELFANYRNRFPVLFVVRQSIDWL